VGLGLIESVYRSQVCLRTDVAQYGRKLEELRWPITIQSTSRDRVIVCDKPLSKFNGRSWALCHGAGREDDYHTSNDRTNRNVTELK